MTTQAAIRRGAHVDRRERAARARVLRLHRRHRHVVAAQHTIGESPLAEMVLECREGGRAYGLGEDGSESDWGRVLVYEPPHRIVVSWDITLQWKHELDLAKASEFEVSFTPEGEGRTLVVLEHRHLDRHGEGWEDMRDAVGSPNGWGGGLGAFANAAEAA